MYNDFLILHALDMQSFTSGDEVTRWALQPVFFEGVGLIALLTAARCNCSLNNHLSGVASLSFSTGLHSVLLSSEASPTRTVAFSCLSGQLNHPFHQGWWLETFLSKQYILTWYDADLCLKRLPRQGNKRSLLAVENEGGWQRFFCSYHPKSTQMQSQSNTRTHTHTHIYIYIYIPVSTALCLLPISLKQLL